MNTFEKYSTDEIKALVKKAQAVYAYVLTSKHDGSYIRVYKNDLLHELRVTPSKFEVAQFSLDYNNHLYIN